MSGRRTFLACASRKPFSTEDALRRCFQRLSLHGSGKLVHGVDVVPDGAQLSCWPGIRPPGEISEYQLIVRA
eukprot:291340-Amphidinium_carterae.1